MRPAQVRRLPGVRRNLVLSRVGTNSLHPAWVDASTPRNWDLRLVPYEVVPDDPGLDCAMGDVVVGPKWSGVREALSAWEGWRDYDYIWFPDDDIAASQGAINRMFDVAAAVGFDLFAPALDEASYYAHFVTMRNARFFGRWVGFVEIMVPGFSTPALEKVLPTLEQTATGWGWGLDSVWPKLLDYQNVGIIDGVTVTHTRPVGVMRDPELRRRVHAESDRLLEDYDCRQEHVTFGGFGEDLQRFDLSAERLLVELVEGSRYLIEKDPRVLWWIADFQRSHFGGSAYPTAGTPS